ncbi:F-box protein [Cucumis melo var. makuwa]|uniref:F-box protein n=1 Tax=Cucumis melo var. makuwa TaxID=1194695 RepID=A0A5D3C489_CUCMM|nr:F-box protein [Cucumis melo var. makuwa]
MYGGRRQQGRTATRATAIRHSSKAIHFRFVANTRELAAVLSSEAASSVAASRSCLTWNTHPPHHRHVTGSGCPVSRKVLEIWRNIYWMGEEAAVLATVTNEPLGEENASSTELKRDH